MVWCGRLCRAGLFSLGLLVTSNAWGLDYVPGEVVVEWKAPLQMQSLHGAAPKPVVGVHKLTQQQSMAALHANVPEAAACAQLLSSGQAEACSLNYIVHVGATPNDPSLPALWGMRGTYGIDAPRAWDLSEGGTDVVVAVIDTGIDYTHPDLAANLWSNPGEIPGNGIDDDGNGYVDDVHGIDASSGSGNPFDDNGHGTHVAGTIGAVGNNGTGVVGVTWRTKMMGLKFLRANGSGTLSDAIEAIDYMVAMKARGVNIRISNNSWGGGGYSAPLENAIKRARDAGIIFVAAAGNESNDNDARPSYPSSYDLSNVLSVAAIDSQGNLASFSNYGAQTVAIAAPGVQILSTYPGGKYATLSGTSMATPHVAGALALLLSHRADLTNVEAITLVNESAVPLPTLTGVVRTGRTLNAGRALHAETAPIQAPPPPSACSYSVAPIAFNPDRTVDAAPVVLQADEFNFHTAALPFDFTFKGRTVGSVTISPNGVIYFGSAPSSMDYQNGAVAPVGSLAVLHSDLRSDQAGLGVRVWSTEDRFMVKFSVKHYWSIQEPGVAEAWVVLYRSGAIEQFLQFSNRAIETRIRGRATVGINGYVPGDHETVAHNSRKIRNHLSVSYVPMCGIALPIQGEAALRAVSVRNKRGGAIRTLNIGAPYRIRLQGVGAPQIQLQVVVNGRLCATGRATSLQGNLRVMGGRLSRIRGVSKLAFVATDLTNGSSFKSASLRVHRAGKAQKAKRLSSQARESACELVLRDIEG